MALIALPVFVLAAFLAPVPRMPQRHAQSDTHAGAQSDQGHALPRVVLTSVSCPGFSPEEVRRIVAVELGALLTDDVERAVHRLSISCEGPQARLQVSSGEDLKVDSRVAPRVVARTLDLTEFPADLVPRALALAGVELLAAESPTLRDHLEKKAAALSPADQAARKSPPSREHVEGGRSRWRLLLAPVRRSFLGEHGLGAWGGEVAVERIRDDGLWRVLFSLDGGATRTTTDLGEARAWLASLAAFTGIGGRAGSWQGSLLAGARAGLVDWTGVTAFPDAVSTSALRPWMGPAVKGLVTAGHDRLGLFLQAEAGLTAVRAEALSNTEPVLRVGGVWLTWGAGLSFW